MVAHTMEGTVEPGGTLTVKGLPIPPGTEVEIIVLVRNGGSTGTHSLRGTPYRFDDPFSPAAGEGDWEAGR